MEGRNGRYSMAELHQIIGALRDVGMAPSKEEIEGYRAAAYEPELDERGRGLRKQRVLGFVGNLRKRAGLQKRKGI